jgi:hypothetical protein
MNNRSGDPFMNSEDPDFTAALLDSMAKPFSIVREFQSRSRTITRWITGG